MAGNVDLNRVAGITVPVLIVSGGSDALLPPPAAPNQATLFTGSGSVTFRTIPDTAHAVTLEAAHAVTLEAGHDDLVRVISTWLGQHVTAG